MDNVFSGLSLIIAIGAAVAFIMRLIGQPLIIGHIITGILVGPAILNVTKSPEALKIFSDLGIALLLFIIGLGLNPKTVKEVSKTASTVAVIQVGVITMLGWFLGSAMGLSKTAAAFLGASLAISSTIIILKVLSDKKEHSRLYGKIAISVSLVQDIIAIILVVITSARGDNHLMLGSVLNLAFKGLVVGYIIYVVSNQLLPRFHRQISESQEFLFLFAIAWGLGSATLFEKAGLSSEIGALLAGICLAPQPYAQEVAARLRPLRDFFVIVFFITLGAGLSFAHFDRILPIILVSVIVSSILKPLVSMAILGFLGYTKRTSFKASVALAQVSEFSIVLVILGQNRGLISNDVVSAITFIALVSIAASTYMMMFSDQIYQAIEGYLEIFERARTHSEQRVPAAYDLVLFGYHKGGHEFIKVFNQLSNNFVVIDYDPEVIDILEHRKINYIYGDAEDMELLEEAGIARSKLIVSTITNFTANASLLTFLERQKSKAVIIAQADNAKEAAELYALGASYVILPHYIGGEKISAFVKKSGLSKTAFKKFRQEHLDYLEKQHDILEHHPEHHHLGHTVVSNLTSLKKAKT
jgi:Kef-type K+ transport system membrane component KefB/voltage-gated potassium channel Kch